MSARRAVHVLSGDDNVLSDYFCGTEGRPTVRDGIGVKILQGSIDGCPEDWQPTCTFVKRRRTGRVELREELDLLKETLRLSIGTIPRVAADSLYEAEIRGAERVRYCSIDVEATSLGRLSARVVCCGGSHL